MAGSPRKRARREAELAAARVEAGLAPEAAPSETMDVPAADEVAAHAKADALINAGGNVRWALGALGHHGVITRAPADVRRVAIKEFDPRVMEILSKRLGDLELQKTALIRRQVRIARWGANEESTRAFSQLAKVAGWFAPIKVDGTTKVLNIHTIMQDPELIKEALAHFEHEPGDAVAIYSEARDRHDTRVLTGGTDDDDDGTIDGDEG